VGPLRAPGAGRREEGGGGGAGCLEGIGCQGGITGVPTHARDTITFVLPFVRTLFPCNFFGAHYIFLGQAWAEGKGELTTSRHRKDSERETWTKMSAAIDWMNIFFSLTIQFKVC